MAYTIQVLENAKAWGLQDRIDGLIRRNDLNKILIAAVELDGRFKIGQMDILPSPIRPGGEIHWKMIRLLKKKEYCGQHPGECQVNPFIGPQKKKKGTWLEWEDWVAFHRLINKALDKYPLVTQVYTRPQDARGKFYIRKHGFARTRFDWVESFDNMGRRIQEWNLGTPDQFGADVILSGSLP